MGNKLKFQKGNMDANFDLQRVYVCRSYNSSNFPKKKFKKIMSWALLLTKLKAGLFAFRLTIFIAINCTFC